MSIQTEKFTIAGFESKPMAADLYFNTEIKSQPIAIYAHGISGFKDWGGMDLIAEQFAQAGIAFLKFNFSHNGTTPAQPELFTDLEAYREDSYLKRQFDLNQILDFIEAHGQELPLNSKEIYLIGHSRGGADVTIFASQDSRIKKLITWAAAAHAKTPWHLLSTDQMEQWKRKGHFIRPNSRTEQNLEISYSLYKEYLANKEFLDLENRAREIDIPWLIVHGEDDEAVFVKDAYDLKSWCPEANVKIIAEANHTFNRVYPWTESQLPAASQEMVDSSIAFLRN